MNANRCMKINSKIIINYLSSFPKNVHLQLYKSLQGRLYNCDFKQHIEYEVLFACIFKTNIMLREMTKKSSYLFHYPMIHIPRVFLFPYLYEIILQINQYIVIIIKHENKAIKTKRIQIQLPFEFLPLSFLSFIVLPAIE